MKLKKSFMTHNADGEHILIDTDGTFSGIVRSNETAAFIVECLKKETTEEEIVNALCEKYDAPQAVIALDVKKIMENLRSVGALDE